MFSVGCVCLQIAISDRGPEQRKLEKRKRNYKRVTIFNKNKISIFI